MLRTLWRWLFGAPIPPCAHAWRVLDKTTIQGATLTPDDASPYGIVDDYLIVEAMEASRPSVVLTLACDKCGRLERRKE